MTGFALGDAAAFTAPIDAVVRAGGDVEAVLWSAWRAVTEAADTADDARRAELVRLLLAVRDQGTVAQVWGLRLYGDLPVFGATMRELWDREPPEGSAASWAHLNAFAAQLTVAGIDFGMYAIWTLRSALEEDRAEVAELLPAAGEWFRLAGPLLASSCRHGGPLVADGLPARTGPLNPGRPGFTPGRWDGWRARLTALAPVHPAARDALGHLITADGAT